MQEIGAADDADQLAVPRHRKPLDAAAFQQLDDRIERLVLADGIGLGRHDFADLAARAMHVFGGETPGPDDEFEPFRPVAGGAQFAAAEKIALGDDADKRAARVNDRQAADPVLQHQLRGGQNRFVDPSRK